MTDFPSLVAEAADCLGVEPGYWDIAGTWHETSHELRLAILKSLAVPCEGDESLARFLEDRRNEETQRWLDPVYVLVSSDGALLHRIPSSHKEAIFLEWNLENGGRHSQEIRAGELPEILPPADFPLGYHKLNLRSGSHRETAEVILCPERAYLPKALEQGQRRAGLAISLYGVRSRSTWGCGDFTALRGIVKWVSCRIGGAYVAVNPLHAIHNRTPFNTSPYLPNSIFYRNLIYLDIDAMEDLSASPEALALRADPAIAAEIEALNAAEFVEYERIQALKLRFLHVLFARFLREERRQASARDAAFRKYLEQEGELLDTYALYASLDEAMHRRNPDVWIWPDWPEEYRNPGSDACRAFLAEHSESVLFHKYVQWQLDVQARRCQEFAKASGMEIGLFHDLPLATDRCGFELWANRRFYVQGCRVGAPPDGFSPNGQDWSFPPPNREAHRRGGYRLFAESIRKSARHGGALRIDHVMRLFRLYWIPDGFDATQGTYVRDYPQDLLRIVALESVREKVLIVGEDLGTVEPSMREDLARFGILSYRLFYFEKNSDGAFKSPADYPVGALVSSTTHDLPTLAGFWAGTDIDTRHRLGLLGDEDARRRAQQERLEEKRRMIERLIQLKLLPEDYPLEAAEGTDLTGELHNAITGFLAHTPSLLMTLNQEDLTKELDQQNLPATTWQYPNWRRKMRFSLEELDSHPLAQAFAKMLSSWLEESGRRPASSRS